MSDDAIRRGGPSLPHGRAAEAPRNPRPAEALGRKEEKSRPAHRPRSLSIGQINEARGLRRRGVSWKALGHKYGCDPRTVRNHVHVNRSLVIKRLVGSHQVHAAHVMLDLWEMLHIAVAEARQPTLRDLARVRGSGEGVAQDAESTRRAFYRIKKMLNEHGVSWDVEAVVAEPSSKVVFNVRELSRFLRREIDLAGEVIKAYAKRSGDKRRFRGR